MKPKSLKKRTLLTLYAFMKYTDEKHRLNSTKLNEILRPYGLDCRDDRVLNDTIAVMRELGIDVQQKGAWNKNGVWIKDRSLKDDKLNALIFAVTTNPHITKEQAEDILDGLAPVVTVYQEPLLRSYIINDNKFKTDEDLYSKYTVICDAIFNERRLKYRRKVLKYIKETNSFEMDEQWPTLFTPKNLYQKDNRIYMVGYNNTDMHEDIVDLRTIAEIDLSFKHNDPNKEEVAAVLEKIDVKELLKEEINKPIYKGPIVFRCRGQYAELLYQLFGPPEANVKKDIRGRVTYPVAEAEIWTETLYLLTSIPNFGVRFKGPAELNEAVRDYYNNTCENITNSILK